MTLIASTSLAIASSIGRWIEDAESLPAFELTAQLPLKTNDSLGNPLPVREDPIFLLGNYRLTLFVHGSGLYQVVSGERLWARLNAGGDSTGVNRTRLSVREKGGLEMVYDLVGASSLAENPAVCRRVFGTGYASFEYALPGVVVTRALSVAPSEKVNAGLPGFVVSMKLRNVSDRAVELSMDEAVLANYEPMVDRLRAGSSRLVRYETQPQVVASEFSAHCTFIPVSEDPTALRPGRRDASCHESFPPSLQFLAASRPNIGERAAIYDERGLGGGVWIGERVTIDLAPGESRTLHWVVSLEPVQTSEEARILAARIDRDKGGPLFREEWRRILPSLPGETDPVWRREMTWHAYVLEAMATYNEFYDETYIPQGQTYDYEMGLTAAPRDHLQHALAACYSNPALAKSCLRYALKKMTARGELPYTSNGLGHVSNSAWNTSDQQLYLFFALGEYLRITRDSAFLNETTEFLPLEANYSGSTLDKLERAFEYLRDEVGTGPHGLIRLMNSDWSDMIYSDTSVFKYFWTAESHMNSAMVLAVFPVLVDGLEQAARSGATEQRRTQRLATALSRYLASIREAFYRDLGDRSFSRRLYFDPTASWGDDNMHVEPQSYLMLDPAFPRERKARLWREVQARILKDERIGPRQRETPQRECMYDPGTGENGGVWFALAGPMILGVSTVDPEAGWGLLRRQSMDHYAKTYPASWVGQWTAPECLNSVITGPMAGLPRTGNDWMWMSFPAYCAHAHAWPLYCYHRLKEQSR